jgi:hypothetical protein
LDRQFGRYVEVSKCKVYCFYFIQEIWFEPFVL